MLPFRFDLRTQGTVARQAATLPFGGTCLDAAPTVRESTKVQWLPTRRVAIVGRSVDEHVTLSA